jgi:hypothetical protein
MKPLLLASLLVMSQICFCQKSPIKYGSIPMEDLTMTVYDKDSSAAAVVLAAYGDAYIQLISGRGPVMFFEKHMRIKILNKNGLGWADAAIPLFHTSSAEEKIVSLKGTTYNLENGKIVETKLNEEVLFKEKFNKYINLVKFAFSNVREGSVIEYSYKVSSDFFVNFPSWQFQYRIPVLHSEYWARIPDFLEYQQYMAGYLPVTKYEVLPKNTADFQVNAYHWTMTEVPAFKAEPYMTNENDYMSGINFALGFIRGQDIMGTWEKLNERLLQDEDFGLTIKGSGFLKKVVENITAGITDPLAKVTAIHNYVKQNYEWDGYNDLVAYDLKDVVEAKKGSSGDLNLMLASMLKKADIDVDPVILSTRDHGFIRKQAPMTRQFNYVVCLVQLGDKSIWLDATEKNLPVNMLPKRCLNGEGLIISATKHGWIYLETKTKARKIISADLQLADNGEMQGKLQINHDGYDGLEMRNTFVKKGEQKYLKDLIGSRDWTVNNSTFENVRELDKAVKETHELKIADHVTVSGDVLYVNPFVTDQFEANPFVLENRTYPVDFGSMTEKMYLLKIAIPENYVVDEIPQSKVLVLPGNAAKFTYNVVQNGNVISVTSNFQVNRNIFVQNDYPNLREFYSQVVAKQTEQIVLKRK